MKTARLILIAFLMSSCAAPRITTYEGHKVAKGKGVVVQCSLVSGEQFEFDDPGAKLITKRKVFFGKTTNHDFITVSFDRRQQLYDMNQMSVPGPDSTLRIGRIVNATGESYTFLKPGARYYESAVFISGATMNGSPVDIPVDQVKQSENLRNLEALKTQAGFLQVIGFFGCLALAVLYGMAKANESR